MSSYKTYILILILGVSYFVAGKASLLLLHGQNGVNVGIFAPEGISLAFALYFGRRVWSGVFFGQLALALSNHISLVASFGIATTNSLEFLLAVFLAKRFGLDIHLKRFKDVAIFAFMIIFLLQPLSALGSNIALSINGEMFQNNFIASVLAWWFGNIMGQLLVAPFILLTLLEHKKVIWYKFIIASLIFGAIVYVIEFFISSKVMFLLLGVTIPTLVYVIFRFGMLYGMYFNVVLAIVSSLMVYFDKNIFLVGSFVENTINYNFFVLIHIITAFISSIIFEQRKQLEEELQKTLQEEIEKNKEQQLMMLQQSRLAQMGEMIAMIAHQWRQPLNNLALSNQFLIAKYKTNKLDAKTIELFENSSKKQIEFMTTTIDNFRDFFKSQKENEVFCINDAINRVLDITQSMLASNEISLDFQEDEKLYAYGSLNDLSQALLNIVNNAKDALDEKKQEFKNIIITLRKEDDFAVIYIQDNAGGIPENIIDKIFDPYFTTKDSKNGTGLGLYMTKMIISDKFNGNLHVENTKQGALFKIYLHNHEA